MNDADVWLCEYPGPSGHSIRQSLTGADQHRRAPNRAARTRFLSAAYRLGTGPAHRTRKPTMWRLAGYHDLGTVFGAGGPPRRLDPADHIAQATSDATPLLIRSRWAQRGGLRA